MMRKIGPCLFRSFALSMASEQLQFRTAAHDRQSARITRRAANRHSSLRAQIHAWNVDHMQRSFRVLFVQALDGLLQLRKIAKIAISFELLLTFSAGKDEFAFPGDWIAFQGSGHRSRLDAGPDQAVGLSARLLLG